jgi:hypothetical protein
MAWPVVDDGLKLDVHRAVQAGRWHGKAFRWEWRRGGDPVGWISVTVTLDGSLSGTLALTYRCNGVPFNHRFRLQAEPCRFGGERWFAICPATGSRAAKLYSLGGAGFHARDRYHRVAYRSQRASSAVNRTLDRRNRILFKKLKGDDPCWVPKPKWMRWKTYDHWKAQLNQAEDRMNEHLAVLIGRLGRIKP